MKKKFKHERNEREKKLSVCYIRESVCYIHESVWNKASCW